MEHDDFIVLPGDCFRCEDTTGGIQVAQVIRPLNGDTLAVFFWMQDPEQCYYLPTVLRRSSEQGVIDKPRTLPSLVFVHHANDVYRILKSVLLDKRMFIAIETRYLTPSLFLPDNPSLVLHQKVSNDLQWSCIKSSATRGRINHHIARAMCLLTQ